MKSWVQERYKAPTKDQLLAEKARRILHGVYKCSCEQGETPKDAYFKFNGHWYPSYIPITKTCNGCKVSGILNEIMDPDDMASIYT